MLWAISSSSANNGECDNYVSLGQYWWSQRPLDTRNITTLKRFSVYSHHLPLMSMWLNTIVTPCIQLRHYSLYNICIFVYIKSIWCVCACVCVRVHAVRCLLINAIVYCIYSTVQEFTLLLLLCREQRQGGLHVCWNQSQLVDSSTCTQSNCNV